MTTLTTIELRCPVCERPFKSQAAGAADAGAGRRTDFQDVSVGSVQALPYQIHLCPRCGYVGEERAFGDSSAPEFLLQQYIWNEIAPHLSQNPATGSEKYEVAAKLAAHEGADAHRIADLYLRAAWCCVDEGDTEAERYYRRLAARHFEEALSSYDGVERDQRAVVTYLVGELWRRVGDLAQALTWFERVPDEMTNLLEQEWVLRWAWIQQGSDAKEWFT